MHCPRLGNASGVRWLHGLREIQGNERRSGEGASASGLTRAGLKPKKANKGDPAEVLRPRVVLMASL